MLVKDELADGLNFLFYWEDFSSHIGKVTIEQMDKRLPEVWFWNVEINEDLRGKGYGKLLIEDAINYVKCNFIEIQKIILKVFKTNAPAVKLYTHAGFKEVGDECLMLRMELNLKGENNG